jgi:hypothetical protein
MCAVAIFATPVAAQAQDADEGGQHLVILSKTICGEKYLGRLPLSDCLGRQNAKADRLMGAELANLTWVVTILWQLIFL